MANNEARWMDTKEVAAAIRKDLKAHYPRTKFSVTVSRYSMGSSVRIEWTDGPSERQVKEISNRYDFYQFDGMQDLHSTADARMVDGELVRASCSISTARKYSQIVCQIAIESVRIQNMAGVDVGELTVTGSDQWGYRVSSDEANSRDYWSGWSMGQRALHAWTAYPAPELNAAQTDSRARHAAVRADFARMFPEPAPVSVKPRVRVWSDGSMIDT